MNENRKPVTEYESNSIKASVWRNEIERDGRKTVRHSVRIKKRYYDKEADEWKDTDYYYEGDIFRLECLRATPAQVKLLSAEPLLGPLGELDLNGIHWVIVGGESGPGARPMKAKWVIDIRNQYRVAHVPFYFKHWGRAENNPDPRDPTRRQNGTAATGGRQLDGRIWEGMPEWA